MQKITRLCGWFGVSLVLSLTSAAADPPQTETPVKEVQLAVDAFSRAAAPDWVRLIDVPAKKDRAAAARAVKREADDVFSRRPFQ